ncbi:hypothetical protein Plec18167_002864 [Paecilomyces lecythidis]|uniref:Uncharacterized protein n=1 Tax=Paecilomyces lecythidis TaxID=3004212 RepID=A0ABR3Y3M6_9EURO
MKDTTKGKSDQADQKAAEDDNMQSKDSGKAPQESNEAPESEFDLDWNKFPWNYKLKWPLTRAERIKELDDLLAHYDKTEQAANVRAAKAWHAQFPPDQIVPEETICFQNGRKVDEIDDDNGGWVWEEGVVGSDYFLDPGPIEE